MEEKREVHEGESAERIVERTSEDRVLEERKKKVVGFLKKPQVWVTVLLILALILGVYIRSLPLTDHGGNPGLWDVAQNNWTLGPDLDPWLFVRQAETIVENGSQPKVDEMRNVPLGFDNTRETVLLPKMIAWTYQISSIFYSGTTIEFAGAILPVIMFGFTVIIFFFFVREIFRSDSKKTKIKSNVIALIATFFMIVIPAFLPRTIAGIPEKESTGFFFMFLALYLFLLAFKSKNVRSSIVLGVLAGIATALMGLIWGGVLFVYLTVGVAVFIAFIIDKVRKKEILAFSSWLIVAIAITVLFSNRSSLLGMLTSISSGAAVFVLFTILVDFLIWKNKFISRKLSNLKIPKRITSIIVSLLLIIILGSILLGPSFIIEKIKAIHQTIFKPVQGRWNTTVAENRQPYFGEWSGSFGPELFNIQVMFFMFLIGSIALVWNMLKGFTKKDKLYLTGGYILLIAAMIFTRYSAGGVFDGENFLSKTTYYLGIIIFIGIFVKIYTKDHKEEKKFREINFSYILLTILLLIGIFSARGSVRTIMVLAPIASIFAAYLIYYSVEKYFEVPGDKKMFWGVIAIIVILLGIFTGWNYYEQTTTSAYYMIPSSYNNQWQYAMDWVRENTAEDAVFAHWWDYGYWVQSIGERPTVLDGGNAITFWNYWMGRLVLTGDNQSDALDFLYSHNTDYLLIDSTDVNKYGAFSSIGSNENFDRYSNILTMLMNEQQTQKTAEKTGYVYERVIPLDEDLEVNGTFLPANKAAIVATVVEVASDGSLANQPYAIIIYSGKQYTVDIRYVKIKDQFVTFEEGINATLFLYPRIMEDSQYNEVGAAMYISPRVMNGFLAQKYILEDPLNNFNNFEIVHTESSAITKQLRMQGISPGEFVYYNGFNGPIKIWKVNYEGDEVVQEKYLDKNPDKYLSWDL